MGSETALMAHESGLGFAVVFVHIPADRACPGSVHRVDEHDWDPCDLRFVGDKCAELKTRPIRMSRPLCLGNRGFRDTAQIFESNASGSAFGQCDETLGDDVIGVGLEPGLSALNLFHPALGGSGVPFLKPGPMRGIFEPELVDGVTTRVEIPIRIHGEVLHAEIDAEIAGVFDLNLFWYLHRHQQKRVLFPEENLGGIGLVLESDGLVWGHGHIEKLSAIDCPDRCPVLDPRKRPDIETDRPVGPELRLRFSLGLVNGVDLGDGTDNGLGRELGKKLPGLVVNEAMEPELVESLGGEGSARDPIAGTVHFANRWDQIGFGTDKFNPLGEYHSYEYKHINRQGDEQMDKNISVDKDGGDSSRRLKPWVSSPQTP